MNSHGMKRNNHTSIVKSRLKNHIAQLSVDYKIRLLPNFSKGRWK